MFDKNYTDIVEDYDEGDWDDEEIDKQVKPRDDRVLVFWEHPQTDRTKSYEAFKPHDAEDVLVLSDRATDEVREHVEKHGYDVIWDSEANKTPVRKPLEPKQIPEKPNIIRYLDEPPDERIVPINWRGGQELVQHRYGIEIPDPEHCWIWPERDEAAVLYHTKDHESGDLKHIPIPNLTNKEERIARSMADPEYVDDNQNIRRQLEVRGEDLSEEFFFSEREGQAVAARERGMTNQRFAEVIGVKRNIANQYVDRAKRKYQTAQEMIEEVDRELFEDRRGLHWQRKRQNDADI